MGLELYHHGTLGMHWGIKLGPPYPLSKEAAGVNDLLKDLSSIQYKEFTTLMSPESVAKKKAGSCHDQTYFEATRLREIGVEPTIHFYIEANKNGQGGATHSLVSFNLSGKTYWMENAWESNKGLRSYQNKEQLKKDIKKLWEKNKKFPFLYSGTLDYSKLKPGMSLEDIINAVEFD